MFASSMLELGVSGGAEGNNTVWNVRVLSTAPPSGKEILILQNFSYWIQQHARS